MAGISKKSKILITVISVMLVLLLGLGGIFAYGYVKASSKNIFVGVSVGSLQLGGMNKSEAVKALTEAYPVDDINVRIECEGVTFDVNGAEFALKADYEATADKALALGREGGLWSKMSAVYKLVRNHEDVGLVVSCDYETLQYFINEKLGSLVEDVQQHSVEIGENELVISNGKSGRVVSAQRILDLVAGAIVDGRLSEPIRVSVETKYPDAINPDSFVKEYNREPKDASVTENGDEISITPEVIGVKIDEAEAREIIEKNKNNAEKYTIPAIITYPEITAAKLEAEYTDTVIGTYSSGYSTSSANRKTNIHLASDKINSLILNPGDVFSFNDVVGPRNAANGYKIAQVYSGGKAVDGIGGGICQVSSTLYNAVVFADLEIVSRRNHTLPVSYVPLGRDATVSYGTIDFKFKNNKETPIKLEVLYDGSTLTVNIYGRKKYIKDISIETAITGTIPYSTNELMDDTMYEGESKVAEAGANGTKVEAYKVIKENGEVVSRTLLARSSYTPTTKVVKIGTKKKETPPETEIPAEPTSGDAVLPPAEVPSDSQPQDAVMSSAEMIY